MTLTITIDQPHIVADTVHFSWSQDAPNPLQRENGFWYRYDGLDLNRFSQELWLEILLALQLPRWQRMSSALAIHLPVAMPRRTLDFWIASFGAFDLSIGPQRTGSASSPWSGAPYCPFDADVAIHFGGGKDSMAMAGMLAELLGPERVLLLRSHHPLSAKLGAESQTRSRVRRLTLDPLEGMGFRIGEYSTNFASLAVEGQFDAVRPGYDRFTVAALPLLLAHQTKISTLGLTWLDFYHLDRRDGSRVVVRQRWRPEGLQALSRHFQRALDFDHQVCSFNILLTTVTTYQLLFARYPHLAAYLLTCEVGHDQRWCALCVKCFHMARTSLACGVIAPDFDYERFFTSPYIEQALESALNNPGREDGKNTPYDNREKPLLTSKWHYIDMLNSIYLIDPLVAADLLSDQAMSNLAMLIHYFGNAYDPRATIMPKEVIPRLPHPIGKQLAEIVSSVVPVAEQVNGPFEIGGNLYRYSLSESFPHPALEVEHVRVGTD